MPLLQLNVVVDPGSIDPGTGVSICAKLDDGGVAVGVTVADGVGVNVGEGVTVGLGCGVAVGVGVGGGVGLGVGVGEPPGA